jgi:hypothetical protein
VPCSPPSRAGGLKSCGPIQHVGIEFRLFRGRRGNELATLCVRSADFVPGPVLAKPIGGTSSSRSVSIIVSKPLTSACQLTH